MDNARRRGASDDAAESTDSHGVISLTRELPFSTRSGRSDPGSSSRLRHSVGHHIPIDEAPAASRVVSGFLEAGGCDPGRPHRFGRTAIVGSMRRRSA
jgi:hypothetical protein